MNRALELVNRMHRFMPCDRPMIFANVNANAVDDDLPLAPQLSCAHQLDAVLAVDVDTVESAGSQHCADGLQVRHQVRIACHYGKRLGHEEGGVERTFGKAKLLDLPAVEAQPRVAPRLAAPSYDHARRAIDAGDLDSVGGKQL